MQKKSDQEEMAEKLICWHDTLPYMPS